MLHRFIPTPTLSSFEFGPLTVHFYALAILLGILSALAIGSQRYRSAGGIGSEIFDLAIYVIPAGIIGGRLYHVITTPELYFGFAATPGTPVHFLNAVKIWEGGMGIWGAVALGTCVAHIYYQSKPRSLDFPRALDALAPGVLVAQAIGRWGNWFNAELFGRPSDLPWALRIPLTHRPIGFESFATFHPTFLYESLWCLAVAVLILFFAPIKKLKPGNTFLLYVAFYSLGRLWIEALRIDTAHLFFGLRINIWVAAACLLLSTALIWRRQISSLDT